MTKDHQQSHSNLLQSQKRRLPFGWTRLYARTRELYTYCTWSSLIWTKDPLWREKRDKITSKKSTTEDRDKPFRYRLHSSRHTDHTRFHIFHRLTMAQLKDSDSCGNCHIGRIGFTAHESKRYFMPRSTAESRIFENLGARFRKNYNAW